MKYLGVDPGDARIGLSVSDESGRFARPLIIIKHVSRVENARRINSIADKENCSAIVVGVPYDSEGEIGPRARASFRLIEALRAETDKPIFPWDETGTSKVADSLAIEISFSKKKRKSHNDDRAAMLILNNFLENLQDEKE